MTISTPYNYERMQLFMLALESDNPTVVDMVRDAEIVFRLALADVLQRELDAIAAYKQMQNMQMQNMQMQNMQMQNMQNTQTYTAPADCAVQQSR